MSVWAAKKAKFRLPYIDEYLTCMQYHPVKNFTWHSGLVSDLFQLQPQAEPNRENIKAS